MNDTPTDDKNVRELRRAAVSVAVYAADLRRLSTEMAKKASSMAIELDRIDELFAEATKGKS